LREKEIILPLRTRARTVPAKQQVDPALFIDDIDRVFDFRRDERDLNLISENRRGGSPADRPETCATWINQKIN
jgi:hypothetical protein